jgi:hypothetical protein
MSKLENLRDIRKDEAGVKAHIYPSQSSGLTNNRNKVMARSRTAVPPVRRHVWHED